jgi:hypothetical protein
MTIKLFASSPDYERFRALQQSIMVFTNPHMVIGGIDLPDVEIEVVRRNLLDEMQELFDEYNCLPEEFYTFLQELVID